MSEVKRDTATTRRPHEAHESARDGNVRGLLESVRQWARQQGLGVPDHGPLPPEVVAQYRRRQTWE